jgi:lipoate-protein ligase A
MLAILSKIKTPFFNIAAEEYLLKNFSEDIFMLYRNEPSIIVGKHQNAFAETNYWFLKENKIDVIRRLSGGGTVFHDLGNLNFTFIQNGREGALVDFVKFTEPIIQSLIKMGVQATRSGRNDILVDNFKISGNAEHVYKNRTLHHGTLLFSSKLDDLRQVLKNNHEEYVGKAVKSVRSSVTNISKYIPHININEFIENIVSSVNSLYSDTQFYEFNDHDLKEINALVKDKYATWEWNYGYSPKFSITKKGNIGSDAITLTLDIEKGHILAVHSENSGMYSDIFQALINLPYNDVVIGKKLELLLPKNEATNWLKLLL